MLLDTVFRHRSAVELSSTPLVGDDSLSADFGSIGKQVSIDNNDPIGAVLIAGVCFFLQDSPGVAFMAKKTVAACLITLFLAAISTAAHIEIDGNQLVVRSEHMVVRFEGTQLVSVKPVGEDIEFIQRQPDQPGIDVFFLNGNRLGQDKQQKTVIERYSDTAARISVDGNDSFRSLMVAVDPDTADVCITPNGLTNRRAVRSVGWSFGIAPEATIILPVVNGLKLPPGQKQGERRFPWPFKWEAQLAIVEHQGMSMMIHAQDQLMRFKAIRVGKDRQGLTFESEPAGPLWQNRGAGGIEWRLSVHKGDWRGPASRYRDWMRQNYNLEAKRAHRPDWVDRITFAVCWVAAKPEFLEALAEIHPPEETLIHLSGGWRDHKYDREYPDYEPNEQAKAFMSKARQLGFHVMPHFNYWAVDMTHETFQKVRDFQIRSVDQNKPEGWYWPPETHEHTRLAYIHPGLGYWRQLILKQVMDTVHTLETDAAFLDQTLGTWNTDNGMVEGMTTSHGLTRLLDMSARIEPDLIIAGEGCNEVSFQRLAFAQAHIDEGWGTLADHHVEAAHPLCAFLWEGHTKLIGYYHLNPGDESFDRAVEIYERMHALPTMTTSWKKHVQDSSEGVQRILKRAETLSRQKAAQ
jgi:hypothetical protein